jgi:hypothetical protein
MSEDNSTKTWKEWAIQTSTELENLVEKVKENCQKHDRLQEKYDDLKEKFIRLETRVYVVVAVITILIEFILRVMLKV